MITDFYDNIPEIGDFDMGEVSLRDIQGNQSRIEDITLREDVRFETSSNRGLTFDVNEGGV